MSDFIFFVAPSICYLSPPGPPSLAASSPSCSPPLLQDQNATKREPMHCKRMVGKDLATWSQPIKIKRDVKKALAAWSISIVLFFCAAPPFIMAPTAGPHPSPLMFVQKRAPPSSWLWVLLLSLFNPSCLFFLIKGPTRPFNPGPFHCTITKLPSHHELMVAAPLLWRWWERWIDIVGLPFRTTSQLSPSLHDLFGLPHATQLTSASMRPS